MWKLNRPMYGQGAPARISCGSMANRRMFVVEVVLERGGPEDTEKLAGYARIGVRYYVIHDPERALSLYRAAGAFQLDAMSYRPMAEPLWLLCGRRAGPALYGGPLRRST